MTEAELLERIKDPVWRLTSGMLYKIIVKGDDESEDGLVLPFVPNGPQRHFLLRLHHRNVILKARQLGFTTAIAILWLDTALFSADPIRCGMIAQDLEAATAIFRDKVKFAYDNLPPLLREMMPLTSCTKSEILFSHNGSSIRVATSMRSGTIHRLHVSEFGKICAKYPDKAKEVVTGSIPAVPSSGILVIESTAEGREGEFYNITKRAMEVKKAKKPLSRKDYRFFFFPWYKAKEYVLPADSVTISPKEHEYFDAIEAQSGTTITPEQRAWYVSTRDSEFSGADEKMWQEYPSTPEEAFQRSTEGCYYTQQIMLARKQGRIGRVPFIQGTPVNTFWDIGSGDGTAIWLHQRVGHMDHFIGFIEGWGEPYSYYVKRLQDTGYVWGRHYLPHDAGHVRQGQLRNSSPKEMLEELGLRNIEIVPPVNEVTNGIQMVRDAFGTYCFDEEACKEGIIHLENYRKSWNARTQTWSDQPLHDIHSEAADAIRQHAQGYTPNGVSAPLRRRDRNWRTA